MTSARDLKGRRILFTRPASGEGDLAAGLEAAGCIVQHRPAIRFEAPRDPAPADRALHHLQRYQWLILTSPSAVRFFMDRLARAGGRQVPPSVRIAAVGPGTAAELESRGLSPELTASGAGGSELADRLARVAAEEDRLLWARAEGAGPELASRLSAAGLRLAEAVFYRTVADPACRAIAVELIQGRYDGVLFTSPSGFAAVLDAVPEDGLDRFRQVVQIAIGQVTAGAMRSAGHPPSGVASTPTSDGVYEAFAGAFGSGPLC